MKTSRYELIGFQVLGAEGGVPDWIQIFPRGWVYTTKYPPFLCDDEAMREVLAEHQDKGVDIVVDYEHQTHEGVKAPAAGWIKALEARPDGLWGRVEWTEEAAEYLRKREYRYLSPAFFVRESDRRVVALETVALTNYPATKNQKPLLDKGGGKGEAGMEFLKQICRLFGLAEDTAEDKVLATLKAARETAVKALQLLGLKAEATAAEIEGALTALKTKAESPPPASAQVLAFLGLPAEAREPEILAHLQTLKAGAPETALLKAELETLKQAQRKKEVDELTGQALSEGKIAAAQKEWFQGYATKDLEGAKAYLAKAPAVVPVKDLPRGKAPETPTGGLTAEQIDINKQLGITKDVWEKYGPKAEG
ncbi:MAG: phage protease [Thermodesulfobacteriota bacterium]